MLQTLIITDTVGPVPIYKNRPAPIQLQWTGCGSESVLRSVLTLRVTPHRRGVNTGPVESLDSPPYNNDVKLGRPNS